MQSHLNKIFTCILLVLTVGIVQAQDKKKSHEFFVKGMQHFANLRYKEATASFTQAIQSDSMNLDAWIKRGFVRGMNNDFQGEIDDYTHVIQVDSIHKWAYISRGGAYNRRQEYKLAMLDLDKAIAIDPKEPEAYNNRGFTKKGLGDMDGACADWHKSKQLGNGEASIIIKNNYCK